jgi:uncharacterized protein YdeI (BOF family)
MVTRFQIRAAATALTVALASPVLAQGSAQSPSSSAPSGSSLQQPGMESQSQLIQGGQQGSAQRVESIEALSNAQGSVQIEGRVSDVDAKNNQFTIADDTGDIDVQLQGKANIREGDRVQVTGTVQQQTFGNNLQAERVELMNPRGEGAEKTLYDQQQQKQKQQQ